MVDPLFAVHTLNAEGQRKAQAIAQAYDALLREITPYIGDGPEAQLAKRGLEKSCFYAKKAMARWNADLDAGVNRELPEAVRGQAPKGTS